MILHDKNLQELNIKFETCYVTAKLWCQCDYCDAIFLRTKRNIIVGRKTLEKESCNSKVCAKLKREESQILLYGVKNAGGTKESQEKAKSTWLKNYGVENPNCTEYVKNKIAETCTKKYGVKSYLATKKCKDQATKKSKDLYGVDHFSQAEEIKNKSKKTCRKKYGKHYLQTDEGKKKLKKTVKERYGVESVSQLEENKIKQKETMLRKYGFEHALQHPEIIKKQQQTMLERYGCKVPLQIETFKKKSKTTCLQKYGFEYPMQNRSIFNKTLETKVEKYGTAYPTLKKSEQELGKWLNELGYNFISNFEILDGKEIDLYCDEMKLGIEYCGLYWHNEMSLEPRDKNYHYNKFIKCFQKDIRLITIFEDEWKFRRESCENVLKSILHINCVRKFARKCKVQEISKQECNNFLDSYHLLGSNRLSKISFGISDEDGLLGVITLGRHHRGKNTLVLDRMCFKTGIHITGGASKLFESCKKWAKNNNKNEIISWSDNRWSQGNVYKKLGFVLDSELGPDYSYVDSKNPKTRISKQSQKKSNTGCPAEMTEKEFALQNGLARIWDCGKKRWIYKVN